MYIYSYILPHIYMTLTYIVAVQVLGNALDLASGQYVYTYTCIYMYIYSYISTYAYKTLTRRVAVQTLENAHELASGQDMETQVTHHHDVSLDSSDNNGGVGGISPAPLHGESIPETGRGRARGEGRGRGGGGGGRGGRGGRAGGGRKSVGASEESEIATQMNGVEWCQEARVINQGVAPILNAAISVGAGVNGGGGARLKDLAMPRDQHNKRQLWIQVYMYIYTYTQTRTHIYICAYVCMWYMYI